MYRAALGLIPRIPCYRAARHLGVPRLLPFNLTLAVTGRCNSRCKSCNIWQKGHGDGLNLQQWEKILESLGAAPVWVTISGGEPFLRKDFVELIRAVCRYTKPAIISIASNGVLTEKIEHDVREISSFHDGELVVNLSVDGIGARHDAIRGVRCFKSVVETYKRLNRIEGVTAGIHSVISRLNIDDIPKIHAYFEKIGLRSFICEPCQSRWELYNLKQELAPTAGQLDKVMEFLLDAKGHAGGVARVTRLLRRRYYSSIRSKQSGQQRVIPCFAGLASAYISFNGDLYACSVKGKPIGSLRKHSFKELWLSERANRIRSRIKNEGCHCTLANAFYSNMMCDPLCVFS